MQALRAARDSRPELRAVKPADRNDRALLDDLPFTLDKDLRGIGAASLLIGNRNIDLKGNEPDDLNQIVRVHGNPARQREHCLRTPEQDTPGGSEAALQECRNFILEKVTSALDGLGASGTPDPNRRIDVDIYLDIRGSVEASLPRYYIEMGRALHALQDGFSHTYRNPQNPKEVSAVLNYVEAIANHSKYEASEDGPAHLSPLDACTGLDTLRTERFRNAVRASTELLLATSDPTLDRASKLAEAEAVMDKWLNHETLASQQARGFPEGCNADNNWCNAPEAQYKNSSACQIGSTSLSASPNLIWPATLLGLLAVSHQRRRRHRPAGSAVARALATCLVALAVSAPAQAQEADEAELAPPNASFEDETRQTDVAGDGSTIGEATEDDEAERSPLALEVAGGGSLEKAAFSGSLGVRYRLDNQFLIGLDGEWNPFWSRSSRDVRRGALNVYGTGILRFPMQFERVNLRSTLQLGVSRMLFDLYGVPEGSTGLFVGFNLLGIDYRLSESLYLIVNPAHVAIPIPQLDGVPYAYPQYRVTVGLQIGG